MNTQEQNKRPEQEKAASLAPAQGSDKSPVKEPAAKADEERQAKPTS